MGEKTSKDKYTSEAILGLRNKQIIALVTYATTKKTKRKSSLRRWAFIKKANRKTNKVTKQQDMAMAWKRFGFSHTRDKKTGRGERERLTIYNII